MEEITYRRWHSLLTPSGPAGPCPLPTLHRLWGSRALTLSPSILSTPTKLMSPCTRPGLWL